MDETTKAREMIVRKGEFRIANPHEMIYLIIIGVILIAALAVTIPLAISATEINTARRGDGYIFAFCMLPVYLIFGTIFGLILKGRKCEYQATEEEFIVKGPGKATEYFYYSDIQDIDSEELRLFGRHRGYIVRITTSIRTVEYHYIFGENKVFTDLNDTPFYYLGYNCGLLDKHKPEIDSEGVMDIFESMVVEQITERSRYETETEGMEITYQPRNQRRRRL